MRYRYIPDLNEVVKVLHEAFYECGKEELTVIAVKLFRSKFPNYFVHRTVTLYFVASWADIFAELNRSVTD